jgi:hypothetical protein
MNRILFMDLVIEIKKLPVNICTIKLISIRYLNLRLKINFLLKITIFLLHEIKMNFFKCFISYKCKKSIILIEDKI